MSDDSELDRILLESVNEGFFLRSKQDYPNGFSGADVKAIINKVKQAILDLMAEGERLARLDELSLGAEYLVNNVGVVRGRHGRSYTDRIAALTAQSPTNKEEKL